MVEPSCPVLVVHEDDAFRRRLIPKLDESHFTVTFCPDGAEAVALLADEKREFHVILVGIDLGAGSGMQASEYLRDNRASRGCGIIILGEPDPRLRTWAPWADETLLKPVDPDYVARRARVYCRC